MAPVYTLLPWKVKSDIKNFTQIFQIENDAPVYSLLP